MGNVCAAENVGSEKYCSLSEVVSGDAGREETRINSYHTSLLLFFSTINGDVDQH